MPPQNPQNNQPNPFGPSPDGNLPSPVDPTPQQQPPIQPAGPAPAPAAPANPAPAVPDLSIKAGPQPVMPAGYTPAQLPESHIPKLHPTHIEQEFPAPDAPKKEQNRYAFFMESKPKEAKTLLPKKSNKFAWIIIAGVGSLLLIIIAAGIINGVKGSQNKQSADTFMGVIRQQQEIIRVTKLASRDVQGTDLANFTATANISTISNQQGLIAFVAANDVEVDSKALAKQVADPNIDKMLVSAKAASVYDTTYRRIMIEIMTDYQNSLQSLHGKVTGQKAKALVEKNYQSATLLRNSIVTEE